MIQNVDEKINSYLSDDKRHTLTGLACALLICPRTLRNVETGFYQPGKPYGKRPRWNRCISNKDFGSVRAAVRQIRRRGG